MKKTLVIIFCLWFLALMATGVVSSKFSTYNAGGKVCLVKKQLPFYRWDSFWYTSISRHGYSYSAEKNSSVAFFPAYPAAIKLVHAVSGAKEDQISFILNILFPRSAYFFSIAWRAWIILTRSVATLFWSGYFFRRPIFCFPVILKQCLCSWRF